MAYKLHIKTVATLLGTFLFALSCVKVETVDTTPDTPISFEVASLLQTKATHNGGGLLQDGCTSFYCNAWFTPSLGTANQRFMDHAQVLPQGLDANDINPTSWAPQRTYFWPRTGFINFFSYADRRGILQSGGHLSISDNGRTFSITDYTIQDSDNIMIADAVYHATKANAGATPTDTVHDSDNTNAPLTGVPTLFHHLLANVSMKMKLHTSSSTPSTDYQVIVDHITLSNVLCRGSITLTNTNCNSYTMNPWQLRPSDDNLPAVSDFYDGTHICWEPSTGAERQTFDLSPDEGTYLTLIHGEDESDEEIILMGGAVMPQTVVDMTLTMTLTIRLWRGGIDTGTMYNEDKDVVISATIGQASSGIASWNVNQKITYNVQFDPVTSTVSFDPAVASWDSDINVNLTTND